MINKFVRKCRTTQAGVERFFNIPEGTLKVVKASKGKIKLPVAYWHIFYEGTIPYLGIKAQPPEKQSGGQPEPKAVKDMVKAPEPQKAPNEPVIAPQTQPLNHPMFNKLK